jgi:c-di-GMP-binding flagellar brake protein YcgR
MRGKTGHYEVKTVSVYPAAFLKIPCPHCGFQNELMQDEPPKVDFAFRCSQCKDEFLVKLNLRQFYRKEVSIPCYFTTSSEVDNIRDPSIKNGWLVDISRSGCGIELSKLKHSPTSERKGNFVQVFFTFPGQNELFKVQGEISSIIEVSPHKIKIGVNFINLEEHQQRRLSIFLMP